MKRQLILVLLTLCASAVLYLLLTRDSRKKAAQTPANQIVITPDGKVTAPGDRRSSVTFVTSAPKPTNAGPATTGPTAK
jgi:hypothetical protein